MENWDFIGQEWAIQMLKQHIVQGKVRHAYLFTGPEGIGKRTLSLRFAMALSCPQSPSLGEPCGICRTCRQILSMTYSDLTVIQSEEDSRVLKVDQIREMQHTLSLMPYQGGYRFALIRRFQEANQNAQNALLKTLEEAPASVILLLTADVAEQLLPTIVSRCEVIRLRPVSYTQLDSVLQTKYKITQEESNRLVHLSTARPGYAIRLLQQPQILEERGSSLDDLITLIAANHKEKLSYANTLRDSKEQLRNKLLTWLSFWRDVLLCASGSQAPLVNLDYEKEIRFSANSIPKGRILKIIDNLTEGVHSIDMNVNDGLIVGVHLMSIPRIPLAIASHE